MTTKLQIPPIQAPFLGRDGNVTTPWYNFLAAIVERTGGILAGVQPEDDTLTALSSLDASAGVVVETAADTFTKRSIAAAAGELTVTNPAGVAGNPTLGLANVAGVAGVHAAPTSITVDGFGRITAIS